MFFATVSSVVAVRHDLWDLIWGAGIVVKFVLLVLLVFSVLSWAIILAKYILMKDIRKETQEFLDLFYRGKNWEDLYVELDRFRNSSLAQLFGEAFSELKTMTASGQGKVNKYELVDFEVMQRMLQRGVSEEITKLEKALPFLATTGSAAPFIGLFGTVWGIMNSFQNIGATGVANLAVVAPGISEALIATAIGLAAAIPAVIAYNFFMSKVRVFSAELDGFAIEFLNRLRRNL